MRRAVPLLSLALLLATLWMYWDHLRTTSVSDAGQGAAPVSPPALEIDPGRVDTVRIEQPARPAVIARRTSDQAWRLDAPLQGPADTYLAERVLIILSRLPRVSTVSTDTASLAQYGLDPPQMLITVVQGPQPDWLALGKPSLAGDLVYARSSQEGGVFFVPEDKVRALPRQARDLIASRLLPIAQDPVQTIEVKHGPQSLRLQAGGTGWFIEAPIRTAADDHAVTDWLQRLGSLEFADVRGGPPEQGGRSPGAWLGSLRFSAGKRTLSADLFRTGDSLAVRRSDVPTFEFELPLSALPGLFPDLFSLRDKHLIRADLHAVGALDVRRQGARTQLVRRAGGWTRQGTAVSEADAGAIVQWLKELLLTQAGALLDRPGPCGITRGNRWNIDLKGLDGRRMDRLTLARTDRCGDIAVLSTGEGARLRDTWLLDHLSDVAGAGPRGT